MANATSSLTVCATELQEYAVAADMARCHLKLFETTNSVDKDHAHDHDHSKGTNKVKKKENSRASLIAMWVLRGRAFAALGEL